VNEQARRGKQEEEKVTSAMSKREFLKYKKKPGKDIFCGTGTIPFSKIFAMPRAKTPES
jgi:hypothetical protein